MDAEFKTAIMDFIPRVLQGDNVTTKKLGGQEITGRQFKPIIERWAEIFKSQEIPPVQNVVDSTAEIQNRIAATIALKFYENEMQVVKSGDGRPPAELESLHRSKRSEAINMFTRMKRIPHKSMEKKFLQALEDDIDKDFNAYREINATLLNFQRFRAESAEERNRLKAEMEQKIKAIEATRVQEKRGNFFSNIGHNLGECVCIARGLLGLRNVIREFRCT